MFSTGCELLSAIQWQLHGVHTILPNQNSVLTQLPFAFVNDEEILALEVTPDLFDPCLFHITNPENLPSLDELRTAMLARARVSAHPCDPNSRFAFVEGTCPQSGYRVIVIDGDVAMSYFFEADSGELVGRMAQADVADANCTGRTYINAKIDCDNEQLIDTVDLCDSL